MLLWAHAASIKNEQEKLVQLESLLSTEALVRFKNMKDNDPSVPVSGLVKTASLAEVTSAIIA